MPDELLTAVEPMSMVPGMTWGEVVQVHLLDRAALRQANLQLWKIRELAEQGDIPNDGL